MTRSVSRRSTPLPVIACALLAACAGGAPIAGDAVDDSPLPARQLRELVEHGARAKAVFVGEVIAIEHRASEPDARGMRTPFHFVTWRVDQAVRGLEPNRTTWTGRFAGGSFGDGRELWVSEVPDFEVGQRALVLANDGDAGACALAGCRDGMLVIGDARGTQLDAGRVARVIAALDVDRPELRARVARSADPRAPFAFTMPSAARLPQRAAPAARAPQPQPQPGGELDALERNGRDPVIR